MKQNEVKGRGVDMVNYKKLGAILLLISIFIYLLLSVPAYAKESADTLQKEYEEYYQRFDKIETKEHILASDFKIIENQVFPITLENYGEIFFVPALDQVYRRLAIFIVQEDGEILYKTDQLATNYQNRGELKQPNKGIAAVSFQDVNGDQMIDIILITFCEGENTYKVGDVLFQSDVAGKEVFYRDYRLSDKLNQYGMNKSIKFITSYLVEEYSTEFLYTAQTLNELLEHGFLISSGQSAWWEFEKWGDLRMVPGTYQMAEYYVFMVYLVNKQGYIVWNFQPMTEYESLYELYDVVCKDIDGDGLKDIVVLARYISEEADRESVLTSDYSIYYQRTSGFYEDTEFKSQFRCNDDDTMDVIIDTARTYWGWR